MNIIHFSQAAIISTVSLWLCCSSLGAQVPPPNYDEAKVPKYDLPELLLSLDGARIETSKDWQEKRRPEIVELFKTHVYGRAPGKPENLKFIVRSKDPNALNGAATRKEITILFTGQADGPSMDLLIYLPNKSQKPVPAFLGLNFGGNHIVHNDPGINISPRVRLSRKVDDQAFEKLRGESASRWQVESVIARGYAQITAYYGDLEPDFAEGWKTGIRGYYLKQLSKQTFEEDDWGAISAWAWGLSRAMDYIEKDSDINAAQVVLHGHSRLGKTALWAGAQDTRFAIVISNDSGEGGASISRRRYGENISNLNRSFPHWFCSNYKKYSDNEGTMPTDQHMLIALMAPRPVYVASAEDDKWADPRGEFLATKHAEPVYALFGKLGLCVDEMPAVNQPVGNFMGYHIRTGKHDINAYDWQQYLDFADRHFNRKR